MILIITSLSHCPLNPRARIHSDVIEGDGAVLTRSSRRRRRIRRRRRGSNKHWIPYVLPPDREMLC